MQHRSRALARALSAAALLGAASPAATSDVTITVTNLRNHKGLVRACMTAEVAHFPSCKNPATSYQVFGNAAGSVTLTFADVRPGRYAIALLHDENANGKADRAAMMIPKEGFGFSRDAKVRFGPPKFGEAAFEVAPGERETLTIRMRYML